MNLRNGATQRKMEKQRANRFKAEDTQRKIKYNVKKDKILWEKELQDYTWYAMLCKELQYIQRNGPRYLELKKVLACHTQGSLTVGEYFTMLKCLWEELVSYRILSACPCGAMLKVHDIFQEEYVLEFLMGLNESYSNVEGKFFCLNLCHQLSRFSY
ncbi:hypothetical protein RGQ29_010942 [Quercus rubra]|uniref:Retrotransposon gag domain-containing protein n=1 Tax=Quercus rubra TaxID=3512 RepID=A0AAN7G253_QUERU|nr:hypothetical protein RGQ29_010942 [Quercus rubra]